MAKGMNEMSEYESAVKRIMETSRRTMTKAEAHTVLQNAGIITPKGSVKPAYKEIVVKKGNATNGHK